MAESEAEKKKKKKKKPPYGSSKELAEATVDKIKRAQESREKLWELLGPQPKGKKDVDAP